MPGIWMPCPRALAVTPQPQPRTQEPDGSEGTLFATTKSMIREHKVTRDQLWWTCTEWKLSIISFLCAFLKKSSPGHCFDVFPVTVKLDRHNTGNPREPHMAKSSPKTWLSRALSSLSWKIKCWAKQAAIKGNLHAKQLCTVRICENSANEHARTINSLIFNPLPCTDATVHSKC